MGYQYARQSFSSASSACCDSPWPAVMTMLQRVVVKTGEFSGAEFISDIQRFLRLAGNLCSRLGARVLQFSHAGLNLRTAIESLFVERAMIE